MKKLFLTLGAVLTMGIASAQVNSQGTTNTAGQINKPTSGTTTVNSSARPAEMTLNKSSVTTPQSAVPVGGQNSNVRGVSNQPVSTSSGAGTSTSGTGGGSTVTSNSVPNTTNTTNATTTKMPDKKQ